MLYAGLAIVGHGELDGGEGVVVVGGGVDAVLDEQGADGEGGGSGFCVALGLGGDEDGLGEGGIEGTGGAVGVGFVFEEPLDGLGLLGLDGGVQGGASGFVERVEGVVGFPKGFEAGNVVVLGGSVE